jgi:hypothetical protein
MKIVPFFLVLLTILVPKAHAKRPANSIGPAYIAEDLFGINYERSISAPSMGTPAGSPSALKPCR